MNNILKVLTISLLLLSFTSCQENSNKKPYLMNAKNGVNPNSLSFKTQDNALERKNKIQMAEIVAQTKKAVATIELKKAVAIAQINSDTTKNVVHENSQTTIAVTRLDTKTKEKQNMMNFYIAVGVIFFLLIAVFLWYNHKKKMLEMKAKLEENRLKHELEMKDKELREQRIHKVLDLAISGQLPKELQQDFLSSLTQTEGKVIESK